VLQCVAVCCSVLQCVAVCCSVLQCVAMCCIVLHCVAVCCSVLQCVALCCSVVYKHVYKCMIYTHTDLRGRKVEIVKIYSSTWIFFEIVKIFSSILNLQIHSSPAVCFSIRIEIVKTYSPIRIASFIYSEYMHPQLYSSVKCTCWWAARISVVSKLYPGAAPETVFANPRGLICESVYVSQYV